MYVIFAHIPSARTQSPDPRPNFLDRLQVHSTWKVENKMKLGGHITVSLSQIMSASHGKVPA